MGYIGVFHVCWDSGACRYDSLSVYRAFHVSIADTFKVMKYQSLAKNKKKEKTNCQTLDFVNW